MVDLAEEIIQKTKTIKQITQDEQSQTTELKLGVIYTIGPYLLPYLISEFHEKAQNIRLSIEENYTHELAKKLHSGELDIIIVSLPFSEPNTEVFPLYEENFVVAMPKDHPLAERDEIALEEVHNETVLLLGAGHCFRDQVIEAYPSLMHLNYQSNPLQKHLKAAHWKPFVIWWLQEPVLPCYPVPPVKIRTICWCTSRLKHLLQNGKWSWPGEKAFQGTKCYKPLKKRCTALSYPVP